jgi:hypothetical protein
MPLTTAEREKLGEWVLWFRSNRPRHDGQADVQRTLAFQSKAIEGLFSMLLIVAEAERGAANGFIVLPRLERRG